LIPDRTSQPARSSLVDLKERNEWRVLEVVRDVSEVSRAELVVMTGLSRSTIANVTAELLERGLIVERAPSATRRAGRGRPGSVIALRAGAAVAVGAAIDREQIKVAVVDLAADVLADARQPIEPAADGVAVLELTAHLIRAALTDAGKDITRVIGVGLGLPGPVDVERGGVGQQATVRRWAGLNARGELSRRLGGVAVFPDNDANFGALGELQHGAGRGAENLLYVHVGPGVGGGLVIGGRLFRGDSGYAGELGHLPAVEGGERCTCGRRGCLSTVAASWAIIGRLMPLHGSITIGRALELADEGDEAAATALHDAGVHTGRALLGAVSALNPGQLVLGGDIGARSSHFRDAVAEELSANLLETTAQAVRVVPAALGDRSSVLGASARVLRDEDRVRAFMASARAS
jgi:predicted NBD/HSP70 family sugar kinase